MKSSQGINKEYYNRRALMWAGRKTNSFWHEREFLKFVKYFKVGNNILDIGCAYGIHVPLFLGVGRHLKYEGMDISSSMLKIARRRYPQLKFMLGNVLDVKTFPRKKYNGFWAAAVMMHIPKEEWPQMITNVGKMMVSEAVGYITLPRRRPNAASEEDARIFSFWTPKTVETFLRKFGWKMLMHGECEEHNESGWWWAIVKLPKKGVAK